jgi:surface protein
VAGLTPNTVHDCYAIRRKNSLGDAACSEKTSLATAVAAPSSVIVELGEDPTTQLKVSATPAQQGNATPFSFKVQCLANSKATKCDPEGTWVESTDLSSSIIGSLIPNTDHVCFAASVWSDGAKVNYACSEPSMVKATAVAAPSGGKAGLGSSPDVELVVIGTPTPQGSAAKITYMVQCLDKEASKCDPKQKWFIAMEVENGESVSPLMPNTEHVCFVAATWVDGENTNFACSGPSNAVATEVAAPTDVKAALGPDPETELQVNAKETPQGTFVSIQYKVQCLANTIASPATECDRNGKWFSGLAALASGMNPNTEYLCFAAVIWSTGNGEQFKCSEPSEAIVTDVAAPTLVQAFQGNDPATDILVNATAVSGGARGVRYMVQCLKSPKSVCDTSSLDLWVDVDYDLETGQEVFGLSQSTSYVCFAASTWGEKVQFKCSAPSNVLSTKERSNNITVTPNPVPQNSPSPSPPPPPAANNFSKASNGKTILCKDAANGETGLVNGILYTKRNRGQILSAINAQSWSILPTTCTSDVQQFQDLFKGASAFNLDIGSWDTSSANDMRDMFLNAQAFNQDLSSWKVDQIIAGKCANFDVGATSWTASKPKFTQCTP